MKPADCCGSLPSGDHGNDQHLQAAEVPSCAERLQPLGCLRPSVCVGLRAEELHSSNRLHLSEHPRWRAQALELTCVGMMTRFQTVKKKGYKCGNHMNMKINGGVTEI